MSTQFSTLMALSAMQTQQSQAAVQSTLAERKRKDGQRRKEQEAREEKEKELEKKLRLKHFEEEKRERERLERKEKERAAKEIEKGKREAAQRDALRYGPKKATANKSGGYPSVNAQTREELRKQRLPSDDEDDGGTVLTREEKRRRRLQSDLNFGASRSSRRSGQSGGYNKPGRKLPGGAFDVTGDGSSRSPDSKQSVKARLSAMPNTLTRLNVVKRDTRTIDEIVRDREREKERRVLNGDQAKDFHDWFGKEKKKDSGFAKKGEASTPNSRSNSPDSRTATSKSPAPNGAAAILKKNASKSASLLPPSSRSLAVEKASASKPGLKSSSLDTNNKSSKLSASSKTPAKSKYPSSHDLHSSYSAGSSLKKRRRSDSLSSDSSTPPPSKRHAAPEEDHLKSEIWKLFGKDRSSYVSNYVDSDDEDMEADASILEKEELRSARIARKEDEAALRDEKLHEDEKRRKKLERERR